MAIAFSRRRVTEDIVNAAGTAAECVNDLGRLMLDAGWTQIGTVGSGYKFQITSPQDLTARVLIWANEDDETEREWFFQISDENELAVSPAVSLYTADDRAFRVILGACQIFLWLPGITNDAQEGVYGHNVAAGIPYMSEGELSTAVIPGECGVSRNDDVTNNIWWLSGAYEIPGSGDTLRSSLTCVRGCWAACRNGVVIQGRFPGALRILPTRHPFELVGPSREITQWANGDALALDPYIAWGEYPNGPARFRGQIYDALLASYDQPVEETIETQEPIVGGEGATETVHWINYSHTSEPQTGERGTYNGSLFLMRGSPPGRSNYCY